MTSIPGPLLELARLRANIFLAVHLKDSTHGHQLDLELLVNSQGSFAKWLLDSLHDVHAALVHHCMVGAVQKICHHFSTNHFVPKFVHKFCVCI